MRGCRALGAERPVERDRVALATQLAAVDSAITTGGARRKAGAREADAPQAGARVSDALPSNAGRSGSPRAGFPQSGARRARAPRGTDTAAPSGTAQGRLVDLDVAGVSELDRLPGIGPALAARIVADREAHGPFGSVQNLERVKGIGPSLVKKLEPHVTFSLPPRHSDTEVPLRERVARP